MMIDIKNEEIQSRKNNLANNSLIIKSFSQIIPEMKSTHPNFKKQSLENVIKKSKDNKKYKFEDIFFRNDNRNINYIDKNLKMNKMLKQSEIDELNKYTFERISSIKIYSEIKYDKINLSQLDFSIKFLPLESRIIKFNSFGNLNLYNCIIFLMQDKDYLNKIINRIDSKLKLFVINLYMQGKPKQILIDDYIPVIKINKKEFESAFIFNSENILFSIIEKAMAKINRSYGNTIRSLCSEFFPVLSDAPLISHFHNKNNQKKIWEILNDALINGENNWIIFSEFETMSLEYYSPEYFISYFILNIFKINKNRYVELLIPENETQTAKQIKEKLQIFIPEEDLQNSEYFPIKKLNSEKIIFMSYDQFYNTFTKTYILKNESDFKYNFQKYEFNLNKFNLSKIKIKSKTKIFLTLHLKQSRFFIKSNNYEVPISRVIVAKLKSKTKIKRENYTNKINSRNDLFSKRDSGKIQSFFEEDFDINLEYINSIYGKQESQILELDLEEGDYYIFFKIYSEFNFNVVLSTYSENEVEFENNFDEIDQRIIKNINNSLIICIKEIFISYFNSNINNNIPLDDKKEMFYSYSLTDSQLGFSVLKFENNSDDKILNLNLHYDNQGMNLISHLKKRGVKSISKKTDNSYHSNSTFMKNEVFIPIYPHSKEIIIFEWKKNFNEISINIRPDFRVEKIRPLFDEMDFYNKPKTFIVEDIFYYDIRYLKGVLIIIVNDSPDDFNFEILFEKLENLRIDNYEGNKADLIIMAKSKSFLNLKIINEEEQNLYKINFILKSLNSTGVSFNKRHK